MNLTRIKEASQTALTVAESLPEPYRLRAFELILSAALENHDVVSPLPPVPGPSSSGSTRLTAGAIGSYGEFLRRVGLSPDQIADVVQIDGDEVHFMRQPPATSRAAQQVQWGLFLALASGVRSGRLDVSANEVRKKTEAERVYDQANFAKNFRTNQSLFSGPMTGDEKRRLSRPGEDELARILKGLIGG